MTEGEWQTCERPLPMLVFLRGEVPAEECETLKRKIISGFGDLYGGPGLRIVEPQVVILPHEAGPCD
jgi:hypothetical protein